MSPTGINCIPDDEETSLMMDKAMEPKIKMTAYIFMLTLISAVGGLLFGYDTGIVSGALLFIRDYFELNSLWQETVVSITLLGALLFSFISGHLADDWGRKPVILLSSLVFTAGALLMAFAWNKYILLGGRLIVGIAIGLSSMPIPLYIAEMAPPSVRGRLVTLNNCFITGGQFVAALISIALSKYTESGWRYMLGVAAIPSIIQFVGLLFLPESPRWLIRRGRHQEAMEVLNKIRAGNVNVDEEFESIKESCLEQERDQAEKGGTSVFEQIFRDVGLRKALLLGCSLQLIQQLSGINTVMYYSATIIQMAGVHSRREAVWWAGATAAVNFFFTLVGLYLVEKIGRRLLTLVSLGGVVLSLAFLGIGFQLAASEVSPVTYQDNSTMPTLCSTMISCQTCTRSPSCGFCFAPNYGNATCLIVETDDHSKSVGGVCEVGSSDGNVWALDWCPSSKAWIIIVGLAMYLFTFAPGMGPMPWTINSEIYPLWARSTCFSISTSVNWFANLVVSLTFLTLSQAITEYGAFYLYTGFAFLGWILLFFKLPETKGKSLEELETLFQPDSTPISINRQSTNPVKYVQIRGINRTKTLEEQDSFED